MKENINSSERSNKNNFSSIAYNVPLADKNWFQTGGSAKYFCQPKTALEFKQALDFAKEKKLEIFILGQGANILISDQGFDGLVICPSLLRISHKDKDQQAVYITVGSGMTMSDLIEYCLQNNIIGLEEFSGIPGTVGGSVYINLHYFQFLLADFLHSATVINSKTGLVEVVDNAWFEFGYNTSTLHNKDYFLVDATFVLQKASDIEVAYARGRRVEIIRHRHARYPSTHTCGSFFRNFHPDEVTKLIEGTNKKMIYVAYYLDKIGVKGALSCGDAVVSHQHANMIVNKGAATTTDIINLVRKMQQKVYDEFAIIPQPECQLIGFKKYPLL